MSPWLITTTGWPGLMRRGGCCPGPAAAAQPVVGSGCAASLRVLWQCARGSGCCAGCVAGRRDRLPEGGGRRHLRGAGARRLDAAAPGPRGRGSPGSRRSSATSEGRLAGHQAPSAGVADARLLARRSATASSRSSADRCRSARRGTRARGGRRTGRRGSRCATCRSCGRSAPRWCPPVRARSKLGQPDPESNLESVSNSSASQPAQRKTPSPSTCSSSPDQAGSVPARRRTA